MNQYNYRFRFVSRRKYYLEITLNVYVARVRACVRTCVRAHIIQDVI